jgi:hypothetical protein
VVKKEESGTFTDHTYQQEVLSHLGEISSKLDQVIDLLRGTPISFPGIVITCASTIVDTDLCYYIVQIKRPAKQKTIKLEGTCKHIDIDMAEMVAIYRALEGIELMPEVEKEPLSICLYNPHLVEGLNSKKNPYETMGSIGAKEKFPVLLTKLEPFKYEAFCEYSDSNPAKRDLSNEMNKYIEDYYLLQQKILQ